ncbi:MAG: hypothetical protein GOVbin1454_9 [Prokaryotic dsDNA virus sp.]|nr:MAG: hypothetical protein GOVbin1454_9 [Prokaryotic dsDNA virus sp.]|tara:strand:- start:4167 stop:4469 length:303 start_codon:yes stop_codon:yes gene_type:complete
MSTHISMSDWIAPLASLIFVAGGGWWTLDAVANDSEALEAKVEKIESRLTTQDVLEVKVEQVEARLEKMEKLLQKTIEVQHKQSANIAAICQATQARCAP